MPNPYLSHRAFLALVLLTTFVSAYSKTAVKIPNPRPLMTSAGTFMVEPPPGWSLDQNQEQPVLFPQTRRNVRERKNSDVYPFQPLDVPLGEAVEQDMSDFQGYCKESRIKDLPPPAILEVGCERKAQMFYCDRSKEAWVDLAAKISISGLLVNVVLSAETEAEITRYGHDHEFLLKHLALMGQ